VGGKLTTCRSLAESTAATVLGTLRVPVRGTSRDRPLPGMCEGASRDAAVSACRALAEQAGTPQAEAAAVAEHAVGLFGTRAAEIWRAADAQDSPNARALRGGLIRGVGLPTAAVGFCVREEWALTLDDLIERRLMLSFHEGLGRETIEDVAEALSAAGGLSPDRVPSAVDACLARLHDRYGRTVPQMGATTDTATGITPRSQRR
jgi:glycerol-3-phosphate dehydrogenase